MFGRKYFYFFPQIIILFNTVASKPEGPVFNSLWGLYAFHVSACFFSVCSGFLHNQTFIIMLISSQDPQPKALIKIWTWFMGATQWLSIALQKRMGQLISLQITVYSMWQVTCLNTSHSLWHVIFQKIILFKLLSIPPLMCFITIK